MANPQAEPDAVGESRVAFGGLAGEPDYSDTDFEGLDVQIQAMFGIDAPE